jgi:hypothetical protein
MAYTIDSSILKPKPPVLSGYLKKLKRNHTILGAWAERYIHVNPELDRIENFKLKSQSIDSNYATSFIDLWDIVEVRPYDGTSFQIEANSRLLCLKAASYAERACWVDGLTAWVDAKKEYEREYGLRGVSGQSLSRTPSDLDVLTDHVMKEPQPPQLAGYLIKLKRNSSIIGSWAERYFRVNSELARIENFKLKAQSTDSSYATNYIDMKGITSVRYFDNLSFQIETNTRVLLLKAKTSTDCAMWVDGLTAYVADMKAYLHNLGNGQGTHKIGGEAPRSRASSLSSLDNEPRDEDCDECKDAGPDLSRPPRGGTSRQSSRSSYRDAEAERHGEREYNQGYDRDDWASRGSETRHSRPSSKDRSYDSRNRRFDEDDCDQHEWAANRKESRGYRYREGCNDDCEEEDSYRRQGTSRPPRGSGCSRQSYRTSRKDDADARYVDNYHYEDRPADRRRSGSRSNEDGYVDPVDNYRHEDRPADRRRSGSRGQDDLEDADAYYSQGSNRRAGRGGCSRQSSRASHRDDVNDVRDNRGSDECDAQEPRVKGQWRRSHSSSRRDDDCHEETGANCTQVIRDFSDEY